jgi:adenosylhomocysteine nucleosidase
MILVVVAMQEEVKEIINYPNEFVKVIITGVGKVNATRALTEAILKYDVEKIYNLGFAGATKPYGVGDIVAIESATYHDFDLSIFGYEKGQVPHHPSQFKSDQKMLNQLESKIKDIKKGQLMTGDYFMTNEPKYPCAVDMEGASLYQVAYYYKIPILSIKVISDLIGMTDHIENYKRFEENQGALALRLVYQKLFERI